MGMNLAIRTETKQAPEAHSWLGSAHGTSEADSITLDGSAFVGIFTDGVVPSGVVIAKITSSGLWAPYAPLDVTNEVQSVIATGGTAGDFTLTFDGETTAAIAYNANAAAVQAALEALSNIQPGDVVAAGGPLPGTAVTLTFGGQYAAEDVPALVVTDNITDGNAVISTPTPGDAGTPDGTDNPVGFLFTTTEVIDSAGNTVDPSAALLWHGEIVESNLPANHGLDAAAKLALAGRFHFAV